MRKHGRWGSFGRIPSKILSIPYVILYQYKNSEWNIHCYFVYYFGTVRHSCTWVSAYVWCPLWVNISLAGPGPMWAIEKTECSYHRFTGINLTGELRSAMQNIFVAWPHRNMWFNLQFMVIHPAIMIAYFCLKSWHPTEKCCKISITHHIYFSIDIISKLYTKHVIISGIQCAILEGSDLWDCNHGLMRLCKISANFCPAGYVWGNIKTYVHLLSSLNTDMALVVATLSHGEQGPVYPTMQGARASVAIILNLNLMEYSSFNPRRIKVHFRWITSVSTLTHSLPIPHTKYPYIYINFNLTSPSFQTMHLLYHKLELNSWMTYSRNWHIQILIYCMA